MFTFDLRGRDGGEIVVIKDGNSEKTVTLTTQEQVLSAHNNQITIECTSTCGAGDAFFQSNFKTKITSTYFGGWNCSTSNEHYRCDRVRDGVFAWKDTYTVNFYGNVQKLTFFSFFLLSRFCCSVLTS